MEYSVLGGNHSQYQIKPSISVELYQELKIKCLALAVCFLGFLADETSPAEESKRMKRVQGRSRQILFKFWVLGLYLQLLQ